MDQPIEDPIVIDSVNNDPTTSHLGDLITLRELNTAIDSSKEDQVLAWTRSQIRWLKKCQITSEIYCYTLWMIFSQIMSILKNGKNS